MIRARRSVLVTMVLLAGALALSLVLLARGSSGNHAGFVGKLGAAEATESAAETPGLGPTSYEAYLQAARSYPANNIPVSIQRRAKATFSKIARADLKRMKQVKAGHGFLWAHSNGQWKLYGPKTEAVQPGVTSFSGATNVTASRVTALVADPDCTRNHCRLWAGVSGGGVWETDNALAGNPTWQQLSPDDLDQNSVGSLVLDPSDRHHDTLYLGTGEGNHCSSGCEAGVGLYKSTNGGHSWHKLAGSCVSNSAFTCTTPGTDSFLGRAINSIAIDPTNSRHIFVGSARAVRGLSHVIGNGGQISLEPGANPAGLYESTNGGATFTEVWDGAAGNSFGITKVKLDPRNPSNVYVTAYRRGPLAALAVARRLGNAVRLPPAVPPAVRRARPDDVRSDPQERGDAHLPDGRHRQRRRHQRARTRRTTGGPTTAISPRQRCLLRRRPA